MYYIIYETTNLKSGKYYIGVHKQKEYPYKCDGYYGSSEIIKKLDKKYLWRETLFVFNNKKQAYDKEIEILNECLISNPNCYNMKNGGFGGWDGAVRKLKMLSKNKKWVEKRNKLIKNGVITSYKNGRKGINHKGIFGNNFAEKRVVAGNFLFPSYVIAGNFYGVSDSAIRKRIKLKWEGYYNEI